MTARRRRGGAISISGGVPLVIASLSVSSGTPTGGTSVVIRGSGFTGATSVTFGGTSASFVVDSDSQITATTPAHALGAVDVVVANAGYHDTYAGGYTYAYQVPTLSSLSVSSGTEVGGTAVTATGTHLIDTTGITINGVACTSVVVVDDTTVTFVTPAITVALSSTAASNAKDVVLTNPAGSSTLTGGYTYTSELKRIAGSLYCKEHRANDPAITIATGVSNWPDFNANGALVQATGANQPTFSATSFNGGPGVTGDGSNDTLRATLTTAVANGARPYILIAGSAPSSADNKQVAGLSHAGVGGGASFLSLNYVGGKFASDRKDTVSATTTSGPVRDTNRHLFEVGMTASGTNELVVDGTGYNSTNGGTAADTLAVFDLFSIYGSFNGVLRAAVVLILNDAPTAQNLTDLRAAFKASTWIGYTSNSLGLP